MNLAETKELLAQYLACEKALLTGNQSYRIGNQEFNKANLMHVQAERRKLEQRVAALSQGGRLSHATTVFGGRR